MIPTLHLRTADLSPVPFENGFRKFCPKGSMGVSFIENKMQIEASKRGPLVFPKHRVQDLHDIIDPKHLLTNLLQDGKITHFFGNAPVDEAQIILLDDVCHGDKQQALVRGEIANALKGPDNILLCEGYGSQTMFFSEAEFNHAFAPNLDYDLRKSFTAGWDDEFVVKTSLVKVKNALHDLSEVAEIVKGGLPQNLEESFALKARVEEIAPSLDEVIDKEAHERTTKGWETMQQFHQLYPQAKIICFAGAGHNQELWLIDELKKSGLKFCILTPLCYQEFKTAEEAFESAKSYYLKV